MASSGQLTALIGDGIPAGMAMSLLASMSQPKIFAALGFSQRGLSRAAKNGERLSTEDAEQVVGLVALVGKVQAMVDGSGRGDAFNAALWLGIWLFEPLPAFGGARPANLIRTAEGRTLVSQVLSQMQSGAYA